MRGGGPQTPGLRDRSLVTNNCHSHCRICLIHRYICIFEPGRLKRYGHFVFKIRGDVHASIDFQKLMRSVQIPQGSSSRVEDD